MAETQTDNVNNDTNGVSTLPSWLVPEVFENLLHEEVVGYKQIKNFKAYPAMSAGENYATIMLKVEIEVDLNDSRTKNLSYMMKTPHDLPIFNEMMEKQNIFDMEEGMYVDVVPEMEKMYCDAGVDVKFGAKCYKLKTESGINYVLLEDLHPRGFKNANRLEGLDLDHIKSVLAKLAKWHAATATRVALKGEYADILMHGFFRDEMMESMKDVWSGLEESFRKCLKNYKGHEVYEEGVIKATNNLMGKLHKLTKINPNEFNVLNHGDCWSNNIMFQYDEFGKIKETYFVDYQIPKYGSPAQDLFYFIISSAKLEIKLKDFDFFIKFYHDHLIENLRLLKYPKSLPTLKSLHIMLYKYGLWGLSTATGVMAIVLLDPTETANLNNFIGNDDESTDFKTLLFSSPRYRKHIELVLPWLYNRGAIDV